MTDIALDEKLEPCPFCGGKAKIVEGEESAYVQCVEVKMHRALWFDGDNDAANEIAEQWNRRASPSQVAPANPARRIRSALSQPHPADERVVEALLKALAQEWTNFCDANPDDMTSPEDFPDHALMTCEQFVEYAMYALSATKEGR